MPIPQVVIVGRPNVGKSSVFNWLAQRRLAIVDDQPGVTRDRFSYLMFHEDHYFELVDTGGMGFVDADNLTEQVEQQIEAALESADVVLFVVDTQAGVLPQDHEIARRLGYLDVPILVVANKADGPKQDLLADEFYRLGRGRLIAVSALRNRGRSGLLGLIVDRLPLGEELAPAEPEMKVAIVGRRNVGKSTFVNTLAHAERMIVSEVPGTTRDSVDVRFELDGKALIAIDTPGLRRAKSVRTDIDFYSTHRAQRGIRRADVVLLFLDASERISKLEKQLAHYISDEYKPCIFVVNKWDLLAETMEMGKWVRYLRDNFPSMWHAPMAFITGQTGKNVKALINHAQMLFKQSHERISTSELNQLVRAAVKRNPPPMAHNRRPKIFYATQVSTAPPTIVLFTSDPNDFSDTYQRYLLGVFRDQLSFGEIPMKLYLRRRQTGDNRDEIDAEKKTGEPASGGR